jgi:acetyl-CoA carboxylase biotin carboxyl carrier protein
VEQRDQPRLPGCIVAEDEEVQPVGVVEALRVQRARGGGLLERSDLTELEVEAGGTGLVLRKPSAVVAAPASTTEPPVSSGPAEAAPAAVPAAPPARPSVKAPLTGIFYASPAPGSPPYVRVGGEVAVGQVIGLIEAMKLFNEIKSDSSGRITRVLVENGTLVKRKQPLLEVDPR